MWPAAPHVELWSKCSNFDARPTLTPLLMKTLFMELSAIFISCWKNLKRISNVCPFFHGDCENSTPCHSHIVCQKLTISRNFYVQGVWLDALNLTKISRIKPKVKFGILDPKPNPNPCQSHTVWGKLLLTLLCQKCTCLIPYIIWLWLAQNFFIICRKW